MKIFGKKVELQPAQESDRKPIFMWLTQSDLTSSLMGPPDYPDHSIPSWEEFCDDYPLSFFNPDGDGKGRNYMIVVKDEQVGTIGYDLLDKNKDQVVLDMWMREEKYCSHGYGIDALNSLCSYINKAYDISTFIISPSIRNKRAIAAYEKSGFECIKILSKEEQIKEFGQAEYDDNMLMIRRFAEK